MSTVTPKLNLVKPTTVEQFSLATLNNNMDIIDGRVDNITPQFLAVNTSDTNWSYDGGIYVQTDLAGRKLAHLTVRLTRTAASAVALTTTEIQAMTLIPASALPRNYSVRRATIIQSSTGAVVWGLVTRIDPTGKLFLATDTGTNSIAQNNQFELDAWWII